GAADDRGGRTERRSHRPGHRHPGPRRAADGLRPPRLPGRGPEGARAAAALAVLRERRPDRAIETNVEFWAAVILDFAQVPPPMMPSMFTAARTAGWSAHILEQKQEGKLVRPSAQYVGPAPRTPDQVEGWDEITHP